MRKIGLLMAAFCLFSWAGPASANDEIQKLTQDPNQWVISNAETTPTRAIPSLTRSTRKMSAICRSPGPSRPACCAATRAAPLVIGDVMYVAHAVPEHRLRARPQRRRARSSGSTSPSRIRTSSRSCAATRSTAASPMATARSSCTRPTPRSWRSTPRPARSSGRSSQRRPEQGRDRRPRRRMVVKDKVIVGISGGEFGVRGHLTAYNLKDGKQVWRGLFDGPGRPRP